jgi:molybdopterin-biosynthesis enzyme MoeA-like protein
MTDYPIHERPELVSQAALDDLFTDAQNWRNLIAELTARGLGHGDDRMTTVEAIASVFPNFHAMAHALPTDTQSTAVPALPGPPDPFFDAVRSVAPTVASPLTPSKKRPTKRSSAAFSRVEPVTVQEFAEAETSIGPITVGYTTDSQLAFRFVRSNEVYLVPITTLLNEVMAQIDLRQVVFTTATNVTRLM